MSPSFGKSKKNPLGRRRSRRRGRDPFLRRGFYLLLMMGLGGGFLILEKGRVLGLAGRGMRELSAPGLKVLSTFWAWTWDGTRAILQAPSLGRELEGLKIEVDRLRALEEENNRLGLEMARLRTSLGYRPRKKGRSLLSRIIAVDPQGWYRSVWLDRGFEDGIRYGVVALTPEGLAGRVVRVDRRRSQLMVVTDPDFRASAILTESRIKGFVKGRSSREIDFVTLEKEPDYKTGEAVVTSGLGGVFPEGLVLGHVSGSRKGAQGISEILTLISAINPSRLERVFLSVPKD